MGLHEADGDAQIGLDEPAVDAHLDAFRRVIEEDMVFFVAGEMIGYPDGIEDPVVAHDLAKLLSLVGPVKARGNKDSDRARGDSRFDQFPDKRGQDEAIGYGAGDIADKDAGASAAFCFLAQRLAGYGV
jgi:hypothetical protein